MDLGIIAEATFFLSVASLAIVITIFVFASSLLGRAIEAAKEEQQELRAKEKEQREEQLFKVQQTLKELEKSAEPDPSRVRSLRESLEDLEKQLAKFDKESKAIERGYAIFNLRGGVAYPGICFLSSAIFGGFAWSLAQGSSWIPSATSLWVLAVVAIVCGMVRLYFCLKKIQEVALTSEAAWLKKQIEAYKIAQVEVEEAHKPRLELEFEKPKPPLHIKQGEKMTINFKVRLAKGERAEDPNVYFLTPPGFNFTPQEEWKMGHQPASAPWPDYTRARLEIGDLLPATFRHYKLSIEAPAKPGSFVVHWRLQCFMFRHDEDFEIVVS